MKEYYIARLVDLLFTAAKVGLNRVDVVDKVKQMEDEGKSPKEVYMAISQMVDEAIDRLIK